MKNQELLCSFSLTFLMALDEILVTATTCWYVEAHAKGILHGVIFKGENST